MCEICIGVFSHECSTSSPGLFPQKNGKSPGEDVDECSTFLDMMNHDIGIDKKQQHYIIKKVINIAMRSILSYLCKNRNWDSQDLMRF